MYNFPVIHKQKEFFQSATRTSSKIKFKNYLTSMPKQALLPRYDLLKTAAVFKLVDISDWALAKLCILGKLLAF